MIYKLLIRLYIRNRKMRSVKRSFPTFKIPEKSSNPSFDGQSNENGLIEQ